MEVYDIDSTIVLGDIYVKLDDLIDYIESRAKVFGKDELTHMFVKHMAERLKWLKEEQE